MKPSIVSLARALSKLRYCSRAQAMRLIAEGNVYVDNCRVTDPHTRIDLHRVRIRVGNVLVKPPVQHAYLALNKPRGYVVTRHDARKRATVFDLIAHPLAEHLIAAGRLDQASEGLLLLTTDTTWADRLTSPTSYVPKVYHVKIHGVLSQSQLEQCKHGVVDSGEILQAVSVRVLRQGQKNQWLEIVLTSGKNRHIRRMLGALGVEVLRLVRVQIGTLQLGDLPKGNWRELSTHERMLAEQHWDQYFPPNST